MHSYNDDPTTTTTTTTTTTNNKEEQKKDTQSALSARIQKMELKNFGFFGAGLFVMYFLSKQQKNTSNAARDHEKDSVQNQHIIRFLEGELKKLKERDNRWSGIIQQHRDKYNKITLDLENERKEKKAAIERVNELQNELDEYKQISATKRRGSF